MTRHARTFTVGVLHPGQMGATVAARAREHGARVLWCPDGRSSRTEQRAVAARLEPVADVGEVLRRSDVVLSICPPMVAEGVAREVATHGYRGVFVEANAISPRRFGSIRDVLVAAGTRVVDGSFIGPPPGESRSVRLYLAGEHDDVETVRALFAGTAVHTVALDGDSGAASALKMAQTSYQKAARALAAVAHALAAEHGVTDHLIAEANRIGSPLADPGYLPSVAARAWRWAPELLEAAETLEAAGLPGELAGAAAEVLDRWRGDKDQWDLTVAEVLAQLREDRCVAGQGG